MNVFLSTTVRWILGEGHIEMNIKSGAIKKKKKTAEEEGTTRWGHLKSTS